MYCLATEGVEGRGNWGWRGLLGFDYGDCGLV